MKYVKILAISFTILMATACNSNTSTNDEAAANPAKTPEDSLYNLVMDVHDEAMPKMGKLMGYQKTVQQQIDSLKALKATASAATIEKLTQLQLQLADAEKQMNDWMGQFEPDPKLPTTEERAKYFAEQEVKAKKMKEFMFAALDSAAAILRQ
jgi:hypothetical protein